MKEKLQNGTHWVLSILLCSLGVALCTKAAFGLSMIAAPPYIIHRFMQGFFSFYTQGTSEYIFEGLLILVTCLIVRRFKVNYLLSFVTAILSGFGIDGWLYLLGGNGVYSSLTTRIIAFVIGSALISLAVAFVFRTTLPPQAYELVVREISLRYGWNQSKVKWAYDLIMLTVAGLLALFLTRSLDGLGIGTVIVTFVNAPLIHFFGKLIDRIEKKA